MPGKKSPRRKASVQHTSGQSYLIFISHSTKDRWIARQIAGLLEKAGLKWGVKAFLDERDIEFGDSISETIRQNIQSCNEFLVLLTRNSIDRPWVLIEINAAGGQNKKIIAVIDKVSPEEMPEIMLPYRAVDLNDLDEYINQMVGRARGVK